jgi:hypothetical protein
VLVAHIYNPISSAGKDQEDRSSKPAQANSSRDPFLKKKKNPSHKNMAGRMAHSEDPEFKPQYHKTKQNLFTKMFSQ